MKKGKSWRLENLFLTGLLLLGVLVYAGVGPFAGPPDATASTSLISVNSYGGTHLYR